MVLFIVATLLVIVVVYLSFKRVPDYERLVLFRMGRLAGVKGPGWVFVFPKVDKTLRVEVMSPPGDTKHSQTLVPMEDADKAVAQALLKRRGLTDTEVDKSAGTVTVDGVRWEAFSSGWIQSAAPVVVIGVEKLRLKITRVGE
jgi:regulator of protease activity HflC (stomatin/prohibitin superfamily)